MPSRHRHDFQVTDRRHCSGFSLTEMIVVVGLILIMASVSSFVFLQQRNANRLDGAGKTLSSAIRSARQASISKGQNHRLVIEIQMVGDRQVERFWVERPLGLNTRGFAAFQGLPPSAWQNAKQVTDPAPLDPNVDIMDVRLGQITGQSGLAEPALPGPGPIQWYIEFNNRGVVPDRYVVNNQFTDPNAAYATAGAVMVIHLSLVNEHFDYNRDGKVEAPYNVAAVRNANFSRDAIGVSERGKVQTVVLLAKTGRSKTFPYGRYDPWQGDEIPSVNQ